MSGDSNLSTIVKRYASNLDRNVYPSFYNVYVDLGMEEDKGKEGWSLVIEFQ